MMKIKRRRARKQYVQTVNPKVAFGKLLYRIWDVCKLETFDSFSPSSVHVFPLKAGVETLA